MTKQSQGFTTVELVVVIGIIVLLMGLVFAGFSALGKSGRKNDTRATLATAQSMLAELQANDALARIKNLYISPRGQDLYGSVLPNPGVVTRDNPVGRQQAIWQPVPNTEGSTGKVLLQLFSLAKGREMLQSIPAERLEKIRNPKNAAEEVPALLDGWGNPIIFVPPGGLAGVKMPDKQTKRVTSVGPVAETSPAPPAGARPFFASAGPDGDFRTGVDNMYSFEN